LPALTREVLGLDLFPEHQAPPPLNEFTRSKSGLDHDDSNEEIFLYHGTNCYRRWEITRAGVIEPGRNNYSFFCTRPQEAYTYARAACLRDIAQYGINSLTCEPVVLKVCFTARTWMQVDFIQELNPNDVDEQSAVSLAVLGPVQHTNIVDILHCTHGRRLGQSESIRTFEDGTLLEGIKHLRDKLCQRRLDAWMLKKLGGLTQKVGVKLKGGEVPELTLEDNLRRLRSSHVEA
jgi:hypothetical protein